MKLLGCVLILWAAGYGWLSARKRMMEPLRLAEALLEDLAVLKSRVCIGQLPLPRILARDLRESPGAAALWLPLSQALQNGTAPSLPKIWQRQTASLPLPLGRILSPLGPLLGVGGGTLARAIDETREELAGFIRTERHKQAANQKISAALCFSGALLVILVLI